MYKTKLGKTDIQTSIIGLGTVKLGRSSAVKYPENFTIPNDKEALTILKVAAESGINLLDTAPAYGNSEERLGKLLPQMQHDWIISTKVGEIFDQETGLSTYNFSSAFIQKSVERSLSNLKRDYLDIVFIHSNGDDEFIIENEKALETLSRLKEKGMIRAIGMSTKTVNGGLLAVDNSDVVMVTHNLNYQEELDVINYANKKNKGIFIKKALASGHVAIKNKENNLKKSFECIYENKGVNSVVLGSINQNHIKENVQVANAVYNKYNR